MPIDELLRERLTDLTAAVSPDLARARVAVRSRGRRYAVRRAATTTIVALTTVAAMVAIALEVADAPEPVETAAAGSVPPRLCGRLDVGTDATGGAQPPLLSADGSVAAFTVVRSITSSPTGFPRTRATVYVCRSGRAHAFARGEDTHTFVNRVINEPRPVPGAPRGFLPDGLAMTPDGRFVAYDSYQPLTADDRNTTKDAYVLDTVAGTVRRVPHTDEAATDQGTPVLFGTTLAVRSEHRAFTPDGVRDRFFDVSTLQPAERPPVGPDLNDGRERLGIQPGPFRVRAIERRIGLEDLFRNRRARPSVSLEVLLRDRTITTHDVPMPREGTLALTVHPAVSGDGRTLVYLAREDRALPFEDGTYIKRADDPDARDASATYLDDGSSPSAGWSRRILVTTTSLHVVDLRTALHREIAAPRGYELIAIGRPAVSHDGGRALATAAISSTRPRRTATDVVLIDTRSGASRILTWHPAWFVRYESALLWGSLLLIALLAVAAALRLRARRRGTRLEALARSVVALPVVLIRTRQGVMPWVVAGVWALGVAFAFFASSRLWRYGLLEPRQRRVAADDLHRFEQWGADYRPGDRGP